MVDPDRLRDWLDMALAVAAVIAVVVGFLRWSNRRFEKKVVETIQESTSQIRTNANGGQSLNDVNKHVNQLHGVIDDFVHNQVLVHEQIKYELALIKRIISYPAEGEE